MSIWVGIGMIVGLAVLIWMLRDKGGDGPKSPPIYVPKWMEKPEDKDKDA